MLDQFLQPSRIILRNTINKQKKIEQAAWFWFFSRKTYLYFTKKVHTMRDIYDQMKKKKRIKVKRGHTV